MSSHRRERETMHYSPVNNEKKSRAPSREHATFGPPKTANVFFELKLDLFYRIKFTVFYNRQSRVHKTYCFPRSQSISVNSRTDRNIKTCKNLLPGQSRIQISFDVTKLYSSKIFQMKNETLLNRKNITEIPKCWIQKCPKGAFRNKTQHFQLPG